MHRKLLRFRIAGVAAYVMALAGALAVIVRRENPPTLAQMAIGITVFTAAWLLVWICLRAATSR
jgi:hypothetical protein